MNVKNILRFALAFFALGSAVPVFAGTLTYTCDPDVAAATCVTLNTTVAGLYNSTFTDVNADIYIQYGTTALASSESNLNVVSYSAYVAALAANTDQSSLQASALTALNTYDATSYGTGNVAITGALGTALGLTSGLTGITTLGGSCTLGSSGCYNAIIIVTNDPTTPLYYNIGAEPANAYDFYALVENQTDEILGTASCISTQGASLADGCNSAGAGTPSAADLFRYSAPGSLVLDSSPSTTPGAYFSYNGGATNGANGFVYNTLSNGEDYAGLLSTCPGGPYSIQDAVPCPGTDSNLGILTDGGAEINMLNAVGFDLTNPNTATQTPEPSTIALLGLGFGILIAYKRRRAHGTSV